MCNCPIPAQGFGFLLLNYNDMKHTFKVGDGMTTENSTAEERMEILQLLRDYGYPVSDCLTKNTQVKKLELVFTDVCEETEWHSTWGCATNPLTYEQMKNYINPTMNTTQAIELLKKGELQIEIEDNLFSVIMFASRNKLLPFFDYKSVNNYAYFDGDFMRGRECALQDVRVIKLFDIVDDEPTEQHKTPFDFIMPRVEKAIARGLSDFNAIEAINSGLKHDIYATQQFKELTVKPIELEVGKWYKSIEKDGSENKAIFCVTQINNIDYSAYGINYMGNWSNNNSFGNIDGGNITYRVATPAEVTEALTKEAVKRGLVKGAYYGKNNKITSNRYKLLDYGKFGAEWNLNSSIIHVLMDENGKWATVVETISLKDAEKELGKKIIV